MIVTEIPKKLAVILALQVGGCIYCILAVGAMIKARKLSDSEAYLLPVHEFTLWIKDFGWLLLALPCVWYFVHVRAWWRNGADFALLRNVAVSGVAALAIIVVCAFIGTLGAWRFPLIVGVP